MNPDATEHVDAIDVVIKIAIFACFIVFGICMWLIRRERDKGQRTPDQNGKPPEIPEG
jgi:hypothetical protein